jgi:hypothetical protein
VGLEPDDLRVADVTWRARPHWVATDQIATVDTGRRAIRHLATISSADKLRRIDESLRLLLSL